MEPFPWVETDVLARLMADVWAAVELVAAGGATRVLIAGVDRPAAAVERLRPPALARGVVVERAPTGSARAILVRRAPRVVPVAGDVSGPAGTARPR